MPSPVGLKKAIEEEIPLILFVYTEISRSLGLDSP